MPWPAAGKQLDWEGQFALALDPAKARRLRAESGVDETRRLHHVPGVLCLQGDERAGKGENGAWLSGVFVGCAAHAVAYVEGAEFDSVPFL